MIRSTLELLHSFAEGEVFTAFDTETTGLKPATEHVIEIGAVRFDRNGILERFNQLINPGKSISPEITRINGISNNMVRRKPFFADAMPDFLSFIGSTPLVAHNAPFDISFINGELDRICMPHLCCEVIDTLPLARSVLPYLGKYNLQFLSQYLHVIVKEAHRAEDDARVCMEIFRILADKKLAARC